MGKKVGILGGLGPLATVDLFGKIVQSTPAAIDQEHLRIIIDNHPQIPPRVEAILQGAESPLPKMIESAQLLEQAGVDFIVMPCNTAHYWYDDLQRAVKVPIINMIACAAAHIAQQSTELSGKVLLLATGATVKTGLYQRAFDQFGLQLQVPQPHEQEMVDKAIRKVKAGVVADNPHLWEMRLMLGEYTAGGTAALLAGCTEIPLLFPHLGGNLKKYDATQILADKAVEVATGE